jgi:hypothetical protein
MTMLRLPKERGETELAYITDSERKLLRRRDAVKGRKGPKSTAQGVPYLGPDDPMPETKHSEKYGYKKQYTDMASKAKDYKNYVEGTGHLASAYKDIVSNPGSVQAKYWKPRMADMSIEAFGKAHAGESMALQSGTYRGATKAMGAKALAVPNRQVAAAAAEPAVTTEPAVTQPTFPGAAGPTGDVGVIEAVIDTTKLEKPLLEEIVIAGPKSEVIQERLKDLINTNSPLFRAATTKALQSMNQSGLVNSSIAQEAVMNSILAVAIPIASADAAAFTAQRMANQNATNAFKAQQNAAYYQAFMTKLEGQIQQTLRQLADKSANWRAVLAERGRIAVTSGMSKEAIENAMKAVTPPGF